MNAEDALKLLDAKIDAFKEEIRTAVASDRSKIRLAFWHSAKTDKEASRHFERYLIRASGNEDERVKKLVREALYEGFRFQRDRQKPIT